MVYTWVWYPFLYTYVHSIARSIRYALITSIRMNNSYESFDSSFNTLNRLLNISYDSGIWQKSGFNECNAHRFVLRKIQDGDISAFFRFKSDKYKYIIVIINYHLWFLTGDARNLEGTNRRSPSVISSFAHLRKVKNERSKFFSIRIVWKNVCWRRSSVLFPRSWGRPEWRHGPGTPIYIALQRLTFFQVGEHMHGFYIFI